MQIGKVFGVDRRGRLGRVSPRGCYPRQISGGSRLKTRGGSDVMQCHVSRASPLRYPVMRRAWCGRRFNYRLIGYKLPALHATLMALRGRAVSGVGSSLTAPATLLTECFTLVSITFK